MLYLHQSHPLCCILEADCYVIEASAKLKLNALSLKIATQIGEKFAEFSWLTKPNDFAQKKRFTWRKHLWCSMQKVSRKKALNKL